MLEGYRYEHSWFPVGTQVWISEAILLYHRVSPIAGRVGVATWGTIYPALVPFEPVEDQQKMVPVEIDGIVYIVEPQFVNAL